MIEAGLVLRGPTGSWTPPVNQDLTAFFDKLEASLAEHGPVLLEIERGGSGVLTFGLGGPRGVLEFVPASLDPPYLVSVGEGTAPGYLTYRLNDEPTPIANRHLIPAAVVREAVLEFCRTGALSSQVVWEEE